MTELIQTTTIEAELQKRFDQLDAWCRQYGEYAGHSPYFIDREAYRMALAYLKSEAELARLREIEWQYKELCK